MSRRLRSGTIKPLRVLVADDSPDSRAGLKALLETAPGVTVVDVAKDGLEAVRLADEHRPDVAVIDVRMPLLDGLDATRRIKRSWPSTRVIAISMCAAFRAGAAAAGADAFLVKGCSSDELVAAVVAGRSAVSTAGGGARRLPAAHRVGGRVIGGCWFTGHGIDLAVGAASGTPAGLPFGRWHAAAPADALDVFGALGLPAL
ncbi:MAG: response regulator transcription factor [Anaerolineae bacterium]